MQISLHVCPPQSLIGSNLPPLRVHAGNLRALLRAQVTEDVKEACCPQTVYISAAAFIHTKSKLSAASYHCSTVHLQRLMYRALLVDLAACRPHVTGQSVVGENYWRPRTTISIWVALEQFRAVHMPPSCPYTYDPV